MPVVDPPIHAVTAQRRCESCAATVATAPEHPASPAGRLWLHPGPAQFPQTLCSNDGCSDHGVNRPSAAAILILDCTGGAEEPAQLQFVRNRNAVARQIVLPPAAVAAHAVRLSPARRTNALLTGHIMHRINSGFWMNEPCRHHSRCSWCTCDDLRLDKSFKVDGC